MKKIFTLLSAVIFIAGVFAQSPEMMSYQAVIRNSGNALVTNTQVGMEINIRQGSPTGRIVYTETQTPSTNGNGLISIEIGGGTGFSAINWANGPYYLEIKTDPAGGTNYTIAGTSQLLSVPYALHAKSAEKLTGTVTETDPVYSGSQAVNITSSDITNLSNLSGVNTGDQDLSELVTKAGLRVDLNSKVDTVHGKGLSANDYTNADKTIVTAITDAGSGKIITDEERERWNNAITDTIRHPENDIYEGGLVGSYQTYESALFAGLPTTTLRHVLVFAVPGNGSIQQSFSYVNEVVTPSGVTISLEPPVTLVLTKDFDYTRKPYEKSYRINIKGYKSGSEYFSTSVSPNASLTVVNDPLGRSMRVKLVSESTVSITLDRIGQPDNFTTIVNEEVGYITYATAEDFTGTETTLRFTIKNEGASKGYFTFVVRDCSQPMSVVSATKYSIEAGAQVDKTLKLYFPKISYTGTISLWVDLYSPGGNKYDEVQVIFNRKP